MAIERYRPKKVRPWKRREIPRYLKTEIRISSEMPTTYGPRKKFLLG
jgi:hypothetical protein